MKLDLTSITYYLGNADYVALALVAVWGAFCVVMVLRRIGQTRFRSESAQDEFLSRIEEMLQRQEFDRAMAECENDGRALPQLVRLAVLNRRLGLQRLRTMLVERFQRDVLGDLDYRLSWIYTVIKSAPMLGLFGTVLGMMGAFAKLSGGEKVDPTQLADDISLALVTTALGLVIAIPLVLCSAAVTIRIRQLEDLVGSGLTRLLDILRSVGVRSDVPLPPPGGSAERVFRSDAK